MTEDIRPNQERKNVEYRFFDMVERMARFEVQLESIDNKLDSLIESNQKILDHYNQRITILEEKVNKAEGAVTMLKVATGILGGVITILAYLKF